MNTTEAPLTPERLEAKLVHAVTDHDRRESTKPHYNRHGLPIMLARVEDIIRDVKAGADPRAAIVAGFNGRLQDRILRECGFSAATRDEQPTGWFYTPVAVHGS